MVNLKQESGLYKVDDVIEAVNSHPFRCEEIPLEAALSFPIPWLEDNHHKVVFFYYSIGGPINNRLIGPPTYRVIASMSDLGQIQFIPVIPQEMGLNVDPEAAIEKIELEPRKEGAESYDNLTSQLRESFDRLLQIYPKSAESLSGIEKQDVQTYQEIFNKLVKRSLIPAYIALNPHFSDWLNSVSMD